MDLYEKAKELSILRIEQMKKDQDCLLEKAKKAKEIFGSDLSGSGLHQQVGASLRSASCSFLANEKTILLSPVWPIKTNKMLHGDTPKGQEEFSESGIFSRTRMLFGSIQEENNISKLASGELPAKYFNDVPTEIPVLKKYDPYLTADLWGTPKSTDLTAAIFQTICGLQGDIAKIDEEIFGLSIFSAYKVGADFPVLGNYSSKTIKGEPVVCLPTSGFDFGSYHLEVPNSIPIPETKPWPAMDCSSYLSSLVRIFEKDCCSFTTADMLCVDRVLNNSTDFVPETWKTGKEISSMTKIFTTVDQEKERVLPGDICFYRSFAPEADRAKSLGSSGHAGIVAGMNESVVDIVSVHRARPSGCEGVGVMSVSKEEPDKIIKFLRLKAR